jgi:ATP synthase F1 epsilon subunit
MSFHFQLISATGVKYDDEAYEVLVPTKDGRIAVLEDHMPLLSAGMPGVLSIRRKAGDSDNEMEDFAVYGGVLQAGGKSAMFVTEDVTAADEISEDEARKALENAQKLVDSADSREALHEARNIHQHSTVNFKLAQAKRRHHN